MTFTSQTGIGRHGVALAAALLVLLAVAQGDVAHGTCVRCVGAPACEAICTDSEQLGETDFQQVCEANDPQCIGSIGNLEVDCGSGAFAACALPLQACCLPGACFNLSAGACAAAGGETTSGQSCTVSGPGGICPGVGTQPAPAASSVALGAGVAALLGIAALALRRSPPSPD